MSTIRIYLQASTSALKTLKEKFPFLAYLLIAALVFWPISLTWYALQYDAVDVYMPWRYFGSESLRQGMVPLWNPFQDGGYPFYADHQYSIWNPELFLVSLITRYNATVIQWLFLIYISLGALGFRFLLKQFKLPPSVWFTGGVLFLLSGIIVGHSQSIVSILGAVWLPWALGAYIKALDNDFQLKDILRLVVCMFLMLAGGYQAVSIMLFYLVLALGLVHAVRLLREKDGLGLRRFLLGHFFTGILLGSLLLGIALSLSEVFPFLSRLAGLSLEQSQLVHFHPKALSSFFYPLAAVQQEFKGTSATAQNIFSGIFIFFLLAYGIWNLKKYLNGHLVVLLVFAVIYGMAAFGPHTPVQSFFYHYIPGCDQFFYAAFYRYFAWLALLIIAAMGLHHFIEGGKFKPLLWFLLLATIFYVCTSAYAWGSWEAVHAALDQNWALSFRKMGWTPALLLQSIVHASLLLIFILLLLWRKSPRLILAFIVVELAVIVQLNVPVTVHGEIRTGTLDNYLASKKEGFYLPSNEVSMSENDASGLYVSIWRNQGNFTNLPSLNGWTSFHLKGREKVRVAQDALSNFLPTRPLVYHQDSTILPKIREFQPNYIKIKIPKQKGGLLVFQQANYPGWIASVNGKQVQIRTVNEFEQGIDLPAGAHTVEFSFENKRITGFFYLTHYGFLLVLFGYWGMSLRLGTSMQRLLGLSLLFGVIALRQFSFEKSPSQGICVISNGKEHHFTGQMTTKSYNRLVALAAKSRQLEVVNTMDDDPIVLGIFQHYFEAREDLGADETKYSTRVQPDTNRQVIPALGFYDIALPESAPKGTLIYSMDVHEETGSPDIYVVVEVKEEERIVYFSAIPIQRLLKGRDQLLYANGYLLPDLTRGRSLKMYLWNNSSSTFTFSNFKLGIIP